ncbi:MAG: hypothetical protein EOP83_04320 [Verrucomicrobiaceae bacterium]|nr:MAG: hypothetical protein EOP83_04320 [Verrucomicrobiaceae bacterium]
MIVKRLTPDAFYVREGLDRDEYYAASMYAAYCNQFLYDFRALYPDDRRIDFNYTRGFTDEIAAWCDDLDPEWAIYENYGDHWPIGFSKPEYLFAFKMRWL